MSLLLLVFGAVLAAAGVVLAANGISIHDRTFDATVVMPGVVAVIGGFVLIGLGIALRILQRIERAVMARPMPRPARPGEAVNPPSPNLLPNEPTLIPLPPKADPRPLGANTAAVAPPAFVDARRPADAAEKQAAAALHALSSVEPPRVEAQTGESNEIRPTRRLNGTAPARTMPRLDSAPRAPGVPERANGQSPPQGPAFDLLWPKAPRPARAAPTAPQSTSAQPTSPADTAAAADAAHHGDPVIAIAPPAAPDHHAVASPAVLKAGVVDGMAYRLFADGSIEAQLPQGTLRFGSITELRNHIEQSA